MTLVDGTKFYILDPNPKIISIETIAHALSQVCRWAGQCEKFYSVAQHSVLVSEIVPDELALQGLLHDASEAFIGDITSPLKEAMEIGAPGMLRFLENRIHQAVATRFGLEWPYSAEVKQADRIALATEKRDIMHNNE